MYVCKFLLCMLSIFSSLEIQAQEEKKRIQIEIDIIFC